MATTEILAVNRTQIAWWVLGGLGVATAIAVAIGYSNRPPQMGTDEEVFKTVDALYTALGMRDPVKLSQCEERLRSYRAAEWLPQRSADYLDGVIAKARAGGWESALERLYDFMLAQRREGRASHVEEKAPGKSTPARK